MPRLLRQIAAVAVVLGVVACSAGDDARLPDLEVTSLDGSTTVNLAALDGPAVVNLWATWCAPCRREMPEFQAVHDERGDSIAFIGVNVGDDNDKALAFLEQTGVTYDQFADPDGMVSTALSTSAMPVTLVIDGAGDIVERHLGAMDVDGLNAAIDRALATDG
jgi:thiol-disulfide isomerase/thioredoxin